jgi:hypothetical protein
MPDEAILALVKNQLGAITGTAGFAVAPRRGRPPKIVAAIAAAAPAAKAAKPVKPAKRGRPAKAGRKGPGRPRQSPALSAERQATLEKVEKLVKGSSGVSASEVARSASIPQTRAAAALKELKLAKRIFQGGDRRFARYAGDAKTAEQASLSSRKSASGPLGAKKVAKGKKKK